MLGGHVQRDDFRALPEPIVQLLAQALQSLLAGSALGAQRQGLSAKGSAPRAQRHGSAPRLSATGPEPPAIIGSTNTGICMAHRLSTHAIIISPGQAAGGGAAIE